MRWGRVEWNKCLMERVFDRGVGWGRMGCCGFATFQLCLTRARAEIVKNRENKWFFPVFERCSVSFC